MNRSSLPTRAPAPTRAPISERRRPNWAPPLLAMTLAGALLGWGLLLSGAGTPGPNHATAAPSSAAVGVPDVLAASGLSEDPVLRPGHVLVLAAWRCSYPRLDRVNEVALGIVEPPLSRLVEEGRVIGWGQFNGEFREEFNYYTYYVTRSVQDYRQALSRVLTHMNQQVPELRNEFYELCSSTRETIMNVVTAQP